MNRVLESASFTDATSKDAGDCANAIPQTINHQLRFGFRTLTGNPAFAAVAVLVLALGIGPTTAIFSVVKAVFIRPMPYKDPESAGA